MHNQKIKYKLTYEVLSLITNDKRYKEFAEKMYLEEREEKGMCEFLDYVEEQGIERGIERGMGKGMAKGENLFAALTEKMLEDSRVSDLLTATHDIAVREKLYKEYSIK